VQITRADIDAFRRDLTIRVAVMLAGLGVVLVAVDFWR